MEPITPNTQLSVRRMCRLTVLVSAICFAFTSFVLAPIYIKYASDIMYAEAWWVYLLYYLTEEGLMDLVVFAVCYPATIYAVWQAGLKQAIRVPVSFALITLGRFIANFFMTSIVDGALPGAGEFFSFDLPYIGVLYLLEMLQYALVILLTVLVKRRYERKREEAALLSVAETTAPASALFAFTRLLSVKNPVQLSALLMAVVLFVLRVAQHQIYQYTLYITSGYTDGFVIMALDLISDIFVAVIAYFVALLLLSRFYRKDTEAIRANDV
jgi:hypothetical protein